MTFMRRHYIIKQMQAGVARAAPVAVIHKDPVHETVEAAWAECIGLNGLAPKTLGGGDQFFWVLTTDRALTSGDIVKALED